MNQHISQEIIFLFFIETKSIVFFTRHFQSSVLKLSLFMSVTPSLNVIMFSCHPHLFCTLLEVRHTYSAPFGDSWHGSSAPTPPLKAGRPQGCPRVSMILRSCCSSLLFSKQPASIFVHAVPPSWGVSCNYSFLSWQASLVLRPSG